MADTSGKAAEIGYISRMVEVLGVSRDEIAAHLQGKPFSDPLRGSYLIDMGQLLKLLPPPPARLLDVGVGTGWTSEMLARSGYVVVGVDIAPDMIAMARERLDGHLDLRFEVGDYEQLIDFGQFDAAVIYDALHHATEEGRVIANLFGCLKPGGVLITVEPGRGHSESNEAREAVARFGTTEKDMEFNRQAELMRAAGFETVRQYLRLSQLPLEDVAQKDGQRQQCAHFGAIAEATRAGLTSMAVAVKGGGSQ